MAADARVAVIILSAGDQSGDRLTGLNIGAHDYVTKPFDFEELVARIRAVMRRGRPLRTTPIRLHPGAARCYYDWDEVR